MANFHITMYRRAHGIISYTYKIYNLVHLTVNFILGICILTFHTQTYEIE